MNGLVKLATIALALLVALVLLDMSFSLVSVGIGTPGSGGASSPDTAGDVAVGPGETGQSGEASSDSGPGSSSAGDSNRLSGANGSAPEIPEEVLAPLGLLWWVLGNGGGSLPDGGILADVPPADGNAGLPDNANSPGANASMPAVGATGIPAAIYISPGPTGASVGPTVKPGSSPDTDGGPSPGSTSQASPGMSSTGVDGIAEATQPAEAGNIPEPEPDGMQDIMNGVPDWLLPVMGGRDWIVHGGSEGTDATYDTSTPVRLPDGTIISDSVTPADTITGISGYSNSITKGMTFNVNGTVTGTDGKPVPGIIVDIYLAKDKASPDWIHCGRTIAVNGIFGAECRSPNNVTPGDYNLIARSLDNRLYHGSDSDPVVKLVAETQLSVEAPRDVHSGDACVVSVTLIDRASGLPLEGQPIDVSISSFSERGVTDAQGIARVKAAALPDGTMTIVAAYPGQDGFLGSTASQDVTVSKMNLLELFLYGILAIVVLLVLAGAIVLAYGAWEKRQTVMSALLGRLPRKQQREPPFDTMPVPEETCVPHPASSYVISFPDIDMRLPAVWGAGEELVVRINGIPGKPISLMVDEQIYLAMTMTMGEAIVPLTLAKGDHVLSLVPVDGDEELAAARVRIVDYREEVVRMFNDLCRRVRSRFEAITEQATPRELIETVGPYVPDTDDHHLDRVITIFEVANYSLHGIGRDDYVKSYLSIRELAL